MKTIAVILLALFLYFYVIKVDDRFGLGEAEFKEERTEVVEEREKRHRKW